MRDYRLVIYRGKYAVTWRQQDGKRVRRSLRTDDRPIAERRFAQFRDQGPAEITVSWLWSSYTEENRAKAVIQTMKYSWKALSARFGGLDPQHIPIDVSREHIRERKESGIADGTIWTELGHLRTVLNWARKRNLVERLPHIERPAKPPPRDRSLTRAEAIDLIEGASMPHIRLAIILLLGTGARVSALLELTWDRVDFDKGRTSLPLAMASCASAGPRCR